MLHRTCLTGALLICAWSTWAVADDTGEVFEPFNGKDLTAWKFKGEADKSHWKVGTAEVSPENASQLVAKEGGHDLVNLAGGGVDIYTASSIYGDIVLEIEVLVPKGSNSGIYVMGEYEVQVLDSFGKKEVGPGDMGGLYGASAPRVNASKAPGEWQKFVIDFRAPKFNADGQKTANAKFVKVVLNGETIHENVEMKGPTPSGVTGKESPLGPLMFQGDHGAVAYRNIKIKPVK
ncbi:MAG TPA: DUF1080 domain-containing protein [Planctomycetaceae bacterium]|nr:DUF1080 domain-containing protein [Planctomycetaceae bacterium]